MKLINWSKKYLKLSIKYKTYRLTFVLTLICIGIVDALLLITTTIFNDTIYSYTIISNMTKLLIFVGLYFILTVWFSWWAHNDE